MTYVYHIVTIHVNETSWAHVWRLRFCYLGTGYDKSLPYVEFSYSNSYRASIKMAPFEALYGRQCKTPLFWSQTGESQIFRPEVLKDAEKHVQMIRGNLKVSPMREELCG
jgi:hypothetical protein